MFSKKDLVKLIIPLIIEQFLAMFIGVADTIMVSSCGEAAVSAVSSVDTINLLLITIFTALATGGAIIAAQYLGRDNLVNANVAAKQLIVVTTLLAVIIAVVSLCFSGQILDLIFSNTEKSVMDNCYIYFFWSALSYPFLGAYNAGAALFRSMGNSKTSMLVSIVINIVNVVGNAILIFVFDMGVAGAAIATLVSRALGAVIIMWLLTVQSNKIQLSSFKDFRFHPKMIKNILGLGIPTGLENGMFHIGKILVQSLIASFGTIAIAANAVANSVAGLTQVVGSAIGLALVTVVGQCVGAGKYDEAKKYMIKLMTVAYISMFVVNVLVIIGCTPLVGLFGLSGETSKIAVELLVYHGVLSIIFWPASFVLPNGLRASNDAKFTMTISIISMWLCRIVFSYVLGRYLNLGVLGVWIAMTLDWILRAICFVIRLCGNKWQRKKLV